MRKVKSCLRINRGNLLPCLLFIFIFIASVGFVCGNYLGFASFDAQEFLVWEHSSLNNVFPYRDIFYPYNFINYFYLSNAFIYCFYILISPILFTLLYWIFDKLFKNRLLSIISTLALFAYVLNISGIYAVYRYGIFFVIPLLFAWILYQFDLTRKAYFILGALLGLQTMLFLEQGLYVTFLFLSLYFFKNALYLKKNKKNYRSSPHEVIWIATGFIVGLMPIAVFLYKAKALGDFINFFVMLKDISLLAKIPYFVSFFSLTNLFTFLSLIIAILYLSIRLLFLNNKTRFSSYLIFSLIIEILILENKSVIRPINEQITIPVLILIIVLISDFRAKFISLKAKKMIPIVFLLGLCFVFLFDLKGTDLGISGKYLMIPRECYENNLNNFLLANSEYQKVVDQLKSYDSNAKVLSFPGDPIFYVLFNQRPPYFNTIYEASSINGQTAMVNYMQKNDVKYVIVDKNNLTIQDNVPNYIRGNFVLQYILNNYSFKQNVDNYLILEKNTRADIFIPINDPYFENLLTINLMDIPFSEGYYKSRYLNSSNSTVLIRSNEDKILNEYLDGRTVKSENLFLLVKTIRKTEVTANIKMGIGDSLNSSISFNACKAGEVCVIDLSRLPVFSKSRILRQINFSNVYELSLVKVDSKTANLFW